MYVIDSPAPRAPATTAERMVARASHALGYLCGVTVYSSEIVRSRVEVRPEISSAGPVALVALRF